MPVGVLRGGAAVLSALHVIHSWPQVIPASQNSLQETAWTPTGSWLDFHSRMVNFSCPKDPERWRWPGQAMGSGGVRAIRRPRKNGMLDTRNPGFLLVMLTPQQATPVYTGFSGNQTTFGGAPAHSTGVESCGVDIKSFHRKV